MYNICNFLSLFQLTYPAWENVAQKALKLASQLKTTLVAINAFIDAVQSVGDAANNLKGIFGYFHLLFFTAHTQKLLILSEFYSKVNKKSGGLK